MKQITVRVPDDTVNLVVKLARKRGVNEADVWRELIDHGCSGFDHTQEKLDLIIRSSIQALTICRRFAGTIDEGLVLQAAEDAQSLIKKYNQDV